MTQPRRRSLVVTAGMLLLAASGCGEAPAATERSVTQSQSVWPPAPVATTSADDQDAPSTPYISALPVGPDASAIEDPEAAPYAWINGPYVARVGAELTLDGIVRMSLPAPTLITTRLRLRPFDDADTGDIFALQSNAHVLRYWDAPPWTERERAHRFIAACREMAAEGSGTRLAVDRAADGKFIGWCTLTHWNPIHRSASLGYCFDDTVWGQGYATEAARALLQWAFETLDLNRVQAEADTRNAASARVLEKLGFMREGTLREDCVVNGEVSDSWVFGLLRREWAGPAGVQA